jgi:hypothetical protein
MLKLYVNGLVPSLAVSQLAVKTIVEPTATLLALGDIVGVEGKVLTVKVFPLLEVGVIELAVTGVLAESVTITLNWKPLLFVGEFTANVHFVVDMQVYYSTLLLL